MRCLGTDKTVDAVRPQLFACLNCLPSTVCPQLFACLNCSPVSTNTKCFSLARDEEARNGELILRATALEEKIAKMEVRHRDSETQY